MPTFQDIAEKLECPACHAGRLQFSNNETLVCTALHCGYAFPIVNAIPCLVVAEKSLFSASDIAKAGFSKPAALSLKTRIFQALPADSHNLTAKKNLKTFAELLLKQNTTPQVLVVGSGLQGEGMGIFNQLPAIRLVCTDVSLNSSVQIVCDGHDLPFRSETFDGVIIQAVLEHVLDPQKCVSEIHRTLKKTGLVYAETPFMQQVHARAYDFTRFTHLGHRRLFRYFSEIESGAVGGTGMALAWAWRYFLLSLAERKAIRYFLVFFARITGFVWKYADYFSINKRGTLDAASGYYFLGKKSDTPLPDRQLVQEYKGGF
jgi:SAM-dependent methyltransferase